MTDREKGLTLVDTVVAAAVVVILLGLAYPGFKIANDTVSLSGFRDRIERAGDRILKTVSDDVRSGNITNLAVSPNPPSITMSLPDSTATLSSINADGAIPWSASTRTIRFRQTGTLKEKDAKEDLNGDGDRTDTFALGIVETEIDGVVRPITRTGRVMLPLPGYSGDVDGDGVADPLFFRDDRTFVVKFRLLTRTENGRYVTADVESTVRLRNVQK